MLCPKLMARLRDLVRFSSQLRGSTKSHRDGWTTRQVLDLRAILEVPDVKAAKLKLQQRLSPAPTAPEAPTAAATVTSRVRKISVMERSCHLLPEGPQGAVHWSD